MDVQLSEEQELLQRSARDVLERECGMDLVREMLDDHRGLPEELWNAMAELGWLGLIVPEEYGGEELGLLELVLLLEEMGRALLPAPYLSTMLAANLVSQVGSPAQRASVLPAVAAGDLRLAIAQLEAGARWDAAGIALPALATSDGGFRLSGEKCFVADAAAAELLIVPARTSTGGDQPEEGITVFLVDAAAAGVRVEPIAYLDGLRKMSAVHFDNVVVSEDAVLGAVGDGWPIMDDMLDVARTALAAEMVGGASKVMELSVEYAKTREQFGRPIGSFQAIQHKCADMLVKVECARSAAYYAAWAVAAGEPDARVSALHAKAWCAEAFTHVAGDGIQVHGGLGFTWEQDLHLYFKRAKASELAFGDPKTCRELAARHLID